MKSLIRTLRVYLLRSRLSRVSHEIEQLERFHAHYQRHLDNLLRQAGNLRADIYFTENPRPAGGTTLRSLNSSGCVRGRA